MVPTLLTDHGATILAIDREMVSSNNVQPIHYGASDWQTEFPDDADAAALINRFGVTASRSNLATLSEEAAEDRSKVRQLFIFDMMWGYGPKRPGILSGSKRTRKSLSYPDAEEILQSIFDDLRAGKIVQAYVNLMVLPYCKAVFGSKFLYVAGLGSSSRPIPLVIDRFVAQSLDEMSSEINPTELFRRMRDSDSNLRPCPERYLNYLETMSKCIADKLRFELVRQ